LATLHVVAAPGDEASAPFMTRETSGTRSITRIQVDGTGGLASLTWWPRRSAASIDPAEPGARLALELVASAAALTEGRPT
jgi:hypothetical protein